MIRETKPHWLSASFLTLIFLFSAAGCSDPNEGIQNSSAPAIQSRDPLPFTVFKSPTCGCCADWVDHLEQNGIHSKVIDSDELASIKTQYQIDAPYQSCHTAVSEGGYVFEGHVPARFIQRFLDSPPQGAIGLSVPGMPLGSPGMEVDDKFQPYDIFVLMEDGSHQIYAHVAEAGEQYGQ